MKEATNGEVEMIIHPGGSLGVRANESLRAVEDGAVPMAEYALFQNVGDLPILGIESIPFLISDYEELRRITKAHGEHNKEVREALAKRDAVDSALSPKESMKGRSEGIDQDIKNPTQKVGAPSLETGIGKREDSELIYRAVPRLPQQMERGAGEVDGVRRRRGVQG